MKIFHHKVAGRNQIIYLWSLIDFMKTHQLISGIVLVSLLLTFSCKQADKCEDVSCDPENKPLYINLVDLSSGVNLFQNATYDSNSYYIVNMEHLDQRSRYIQQSYLIELPDITRNSGKQYYQFVLQDDFAIVFTLDVAKVEDECCTSYQLNSFEAVSVPFEFDAANLVATIFIETGK